MRFVGRPMKTCLALSLSFTFVYSAYLAIQNLQSSLNDTANLGLASLSVLYGTIILFGTQAHTIIRLFSAKRVLIAAWIFQIIYTATNFYPTWLTLIPSSFLLGAIAAPMWTSQGLYITSASEEYAASRAMSSTYELHSVLSRFNGIFFMFYEVTQVAGNLLSSLVLSADSTTERNETEVKYCGVNECDAPASTGNSTGSTKPSHEVIYTLLGIFLGLNICGLLITTFALPPLKQKQQKESNSVSGDLFRCFKATLDFRMLPLLPLFMAQAMAVGVLYADYTRAFITCSIGVSWVGYVMASYGLLCAVFALTINYLAAYLGRVFLFIVAVLVDMATLFTMLFWVPSNHHILLFFLVPACSGIAEGIMQAQFNTLIAQLFKDNMSPAFATYHTSKATSFTITFVLSMFLCLEYRLYIAIGLYSVGLIGYMFTEIRYKRGAWFDPNENTRSMMTATNA